VGFLREVSQLLFFFSALSAVFGILFMTATWEPEVLGAALGAFFQAIVYLVLGIFIRYGSVKALSVAGILFALDTVLQFTQPSGKGLGAAIVSRGILIYVLVRYVNRERKSA
jgi:hypothetical protein